MAVDPLSVTPLQTPDVLATERPNLGLGGATVHITELRTRLLWCIGVTLVFTLTSCAFSEPLTRWLLTLAPKGLVFIQLAPGEAFMASLKVSFMLGLSISLPVWLYHAGCFVLPGLHPHEKKQLVSLVIAGLCLFALGATFGLLVLGPQTTAWLTGFGDTLAVNQLSLARYLDFILMLVLLTGIAGELPLVLIGLVLTGLLPKATLLSRWREGIIGLFMAGAILTPSQDPFSMLLVGVALLGLYGVSLLVVVGLPDKR
jgi:sec-independent protein translocase protein TatC